MLLAQAGSVRPATANEGASYKYQSYQEPGGRIRVISHYALVEKNLTAADVVKLQGVIDTITGASPTGVPPPAGSDQVPLASLDDRREAWLIDVAHQFSRVSLSAGYADSRESDYVSAAWSVNTRWDFNQKNTTVLAGYSRVRDEVQPSFFAAAREKDGHDAIVGVTQLLDPRSSATFNLTYSRTEGYLGDPYKIIRKTVEVLPGLTLPLTFPENRPSERTKWIFLAGWNRAFERPRAAIDASYRFFRDDAGMESHTVTVEWLHRFGERLIVKPGVRFYRQSAADYYTVSLDGSSIVPPAAPTGRAPYYSADYRLSAMRTMTYGLKLVYEVTGRVTFDAAVERYEMDGRDGVTPASAYPDANLYTAGLKLWF